MANGNLMRNEVYDQFGKCVVHGDFTREQCTCMVQSHLKSSKDHNGIGIFHVWSIEFEFSIFPPKCSCMDKWSCELISCKAMIDLENIGHKKQFAKRVTQFGVL